MLFTNWKRRKMTLSDRVFSLYFLDILLPSFSHQPPAAQWLLLFLDSMSRSLSWVLAAYSHSAAATCSVSTFLASGSSCAYSTHSPTAIWYPQAFTDCKYNRKNVIGWWQKKEETDFRICQITDRQENTEELETKLRTMLKAQVLTPPPLLSNTFL